MTKLTMLSSTPISSSMLLNASTWNIFEPPASESITIDTKSLLRISITTPVAMTTGRKKIARIRVRPRNLWLSSSAMIMLNTRMVGT